MGVEIFHPKRKTCLRCDWSKKGVGFYLCQKHCNCESSAPDCCENGWRITACGSRFLQKNEERYAPIEGEALAVAWALDQTKFFTLGCADLIVVVDHKPLIKIFGDRHLDEIDNTRIFRLKQRTLRWKFNICWRPGKSNHFSDAVSRHPVNQEVEEEAGVTAFISLVNSILEEEEQAEVALLQSKINLNKVVAITWEKVQEATYDEYSDILAYLKGHIPDNDAEFNRQYDELKVYRDRLHVIDDVIMYEDRVLIPPSLRTATMETLHAVHQGERGMSLLAQSTVFWPGIAKDIQKTRKTCNPCIRNAPSQPKSTPIPPIIPTTPFEAVVADYFKFGGNYYLVVADRLSGWSEVYHVGIGTSTSGSHGLTILLKNFCGTFGVPVELSSDQGPEFMADETQDFLLRWGIKHRDSAAYHPQSNGRAELAVKATKRLLENNIGADGKLDTDNFLRALLIKRNTPDPTCKLSPAEIIFGRNLRDTLPRIDKKTNVFHNAGLRPEWRDAWKQKEEALRTRYHGCQQRLAEHSRDLPALFPGDMVSIQNQTGRRPTKWERTGTIVETRDHNKYIVKVDGSGRLTMRNRRFLRKLFVDKAMFQSPQPALLPPALPPPRNTASRRVTESPSHHSLPQFQDAPAVSHDAAPSEDDQAVEETATTREELCLEPVIRAPRAVEPVIWNPDRPTRARNTRKVYDANTGTYTDRVL